MDLDLEARKRGEALKILITRLRYLGDVILTTPAIAALKSRYPGSQIHYLAESPYSQVLKENPHLDGIIDLGDGLLSSLKEIRSKRFTAAVDLFYNPRSAWILFFSRIPIRFGGTRKWRKRLYTDTFTVPSHVRSAIEHHLHALEALDVRGAPQAPRVYLLDEEIREGKGLLARITGRDEGVIALHPGGTWPSKRWPPGAFAELARLTRQRTGMELLLVTGPGEEAIVRAVADGAGEGVHIMPLQPIRRLAAVLSSCEAVVSNDGGVMHLAVALERPTVAVFGPTEPDIWFPYGSIGPYSVVTTGEECAPCHLHECGDMKCLDGMEPEKVYTELERVLKWRV